MDNRPIKYNPKGKYDLNFIDWQNQYENIMQCDYDGDSIPKQSPIQGMSAQQFHNLMLKDSIQFELEQQNLEKQLLGMGLQLDNIKKMKIGQSKKDCSICLKVFVKGQIIRLLKCKHIFHDTCIVPWLELRSCCPNCRTNLKQ